MTSTEVRSRFLKFFEGKKHAIVPSAPMVIKNDPTLMFTNAGMNQFKDFFLGNEEAKDKRVADTQKCLRVSGKHNDLEEVGVDTYHHTMFEMLGNWSFGDYFKKDAINWAWEFLTEDLKLDKDRLYVSVFEGDKSENLDLDTEAKEIWLNHVAEDRIINGNKKDNFWEMGETGPCGPASEIHIDLRNDEERAKEDGATLVNMDHEQVIEIWNLVFMQYNRMADGSLIKLPAQHVDTGMGLERVVRAVNHLQSNYDIDIFQNMISFLAKKSGITYGKEEKTDIAMRVVADHIRAIAFAIADGQLPSNTGAGYVIRRILRRAVRYGYQVLNFTEPFMYELFMVLEKDMGEAFPELVKQRDVISKVIKEEETSFFRTLAQGVKRMEALIADSKDQIAGKAAFELYDTYGFPYDLTALMAKENGLTVDEAGFKASLQEQKERSRSATKVSSGDWVEVKEGEPTFVGYDNLEAEVAVLRYREQEQKGKKFYQLVLDQTPFYPEGGGQVGDKGVLVLGDEKIAIFDTKKENNLIVHFANAIPQSPNKKYRAIVDEVKRQRSMANHSATHLLHHALRSVLGDHVEQKGSLVNSDYLRFDFSHFSKVEAEDLQKIEDAVNNEIFNGVALQEFREIGIDEAKAKGAMALFGEKYGDTVRMIQFGDSKELCGGTHVQNTASIGLFKIKSEGAVAAGVRRIEALTSKGAFDYLSGKASQLDEVAVIVKNPKNAVKAVQDLSDKNSSLNKELEKLQKEKVKGMKKDLVSAIEDHNDMKVLVTKVELDAGSVKDLLFQLKGEQDNLVAVIGGSANGKPSLSVMIADNIVSTKDWNAGTWVREAGKFIQGGGGGQPFFATAGGKNVDGLDEALSFLKDKIKS